MSTRPRPTVSVPSSSSVPRPRPGGFKVPFKAPALEEPDPYRRPCQPVVPLPRQAELAALHAQQRVVTEDLAAAQRRKKEQYADSFDRLERVLTLENACNAVLLERLDQFTQLTVEIYNKLADNRQRTNADEARMDAFGTQLWNISVSLLQTAGDNIDKETKCFIAKIRRVAVIQLELGATQPYDCQTAARLFLTLVQSALLWLELDISEAQKLLQKCSTYLLYLGDTPDQESREMAAEALASHHCAKFAFAQATKTGVAEYELEKAIECCAHASPNSWAFDETVNGSLNQAQNLYQDGMAAQQDSEDRLSLVNSALTLLKSVVTLMNGHRRYNAISQIALKKLAQCHYEIAQARGDKEHHEQAHATLLEREKELQGEEKKRQLAQSMLLRLEILEEKKANAEDLLALWKNFTMLREIKAEDVDRIIRLLAARENERLLVGAYAFEVGHMVIDAILWRPEGEVQRMIGKLLLSLFGFIRIKKEDDVKMIDKILNNILSASFELNQDVTHSCQAALFRLGEQRKEVRILQLAAHEVFSCDPSNIIRASRKAAWVCIEKGTFEEALRVLQTVPINSKESSETWVAFCITHIHRKDETLAIESLKGLLAASDCRCELLPLVIKEAQEARMTLLLIEALKALVQLANSNETTSNLNVLVILRTVLKLQMDAAERIGGFNIETCVAFCSTLESALNVIDQVSKENSEDDEKVDITTWFLKTTYTVMNDDKHTITPELRMELANLTLCLCMCRKDFVKPMDDECYHVALWSSLHLLTALVTQAQTVEASNEKQYIDGWTAVIESAYRNFIFLGSAMEHNTGGVASFKGVDTAIEVILGDALIKIKNWDLLLSHLEESKETMPFEALEAIADLVCKNESSSNSLQGIIVSKVIESLWDPILDTARDVDRLSAWMKKMIQIRLDGDSMLSSIELFNAVQNALTKSESLRQKWPKDSLQSMYTTSWNLGHDLINQGDVEAAQSFFATSVRLARLDDTAQDRVTEMERSLDSLKKKKEAAGLWIQADLVD